MKKLVNFLTLIVIACTLLGCGKSELALRDFSQYKDIPTDTLPTSINVRIADSTFGDYVVSDAATIQIIMDKLNNQVFVKVKKGLVGGNGKIKLKFNGEHYIISTFKLSQSNSDYSYKTDESGTTLASYLTDLATQRGVELANNPDGLNDKIWNS